MLHWRWEGMTPVLLLRKKASECGVITANSSGLPLGWSLRPYERLDSNGMLTRFAGLVARWRNGSLKIAGRIVDRQREIRCSEFGLGLSK